MNLYNPYILIPLAVWVITQLAKFLLAAIKSNNHFDLRYLYASGGMPSAHSAVVCSLAMTALLRSGLTSPIFGLSAVFAAIVMYDSFGVRRAAGEQAAAINAILDTMTKQPLGFSHPGERLREILGHKPLEVTVGAISGIVLALIFNARFLEGQIDWLTAFSNRPESIAYMAVSLGVIVIGLVAILILKHRYQASKIIKRLTTNVLMMSLSLGIVGLILGFANYQKALYLGWRLWIYVLSGIAVIWVLILIGSFSKRLPQELAREAEQRRIRHWLPGKRKSRRRG